MSETNNDDKTLLEMDMGERLDFMAEWLELAEDTLRTLEAGKYEGLTPEEVQEESIMAINALQSIFDAQNALGEAMEGDYTNGMDIMGSTFNAERIVAHLTVPMEDTEQRLIKLNIIEMLTYAGDAAGLLQRDIFEAMDKQGVQFR